MGNRIERFVFLPLTLGCVSESTIAVGGQFQCRSNSNRNNTRRTLARILEDEREEEQRADDDEGSLYEGNLKNISSFLAVPKFQSLLKNLKNLSQLFVYKDEEIEEDNMGIDIGFPTDVKHVTHIGIDGCSTSILSRGWDNLKGTPLHTPARVQAQAQAPVPSPVHLIPSEFAVGHQGEELNLRLPSENTHQQESNACIQYDSQP